MSYKGPWRSSRCSSSKIQVLLWAQSIFRILIQVITASSDATVRIWDGKSCECVQAFRPPQSGTGELAINNVHLFPQNLDHLVVCNRSSTVFIMTMQGQVVHSLSCRLLQWATTYQLFWWRMTLLNGRSAQYTQWVRFSEAWSTEHPRA